MVAFVTMELKNAIIIVMGVLADDTFVFVLIILACTIRIIPERSILDEGLRFLIF